MSLYGTALWMHIVLAILLVGGSAWTHVATTRLHRVRTRDEARAHTATVNGFVRASGPLALGTLVAGAYLATAGSHWSSPWLVVSLVLFTLIGALSATRVDPALRRLVTALDDAPPGPLTSTAVAALAAPGLGPVPATFAGFDLAIVFLMSNKPGWTTSLVAAGLGLAVGLSLAAHGRRHAVSVTV